MDTEKEKMIFGKPYKAFDSELLNERQKAKEMLYDFNNLRPGKIEERNKILKDLLDHTGANFFLNNHFDAIMDIIYRLVTTSSRITILLLLIVQK